MIKKLPLRFIVSGFILLLLHTAFNPVKAQCTNIDFENGNLNGWQGSWSGGTCSSVVFGQCYGCQIVDPNQYIGFNLGPQNTGPIDTFKHHIMNAGNDPNLLTLGDTLPVVYPGSGQYSACIGNTQPDVTGNGEGATMAYTFLITPATAFFTYHYATVLMDGGHVAGDGDYFKIQFSTDTDIAVNGNQYTTGEIADSALGYRLAALVSGARVLYHPWTSVTADLRAYMGQNVTVKFTVRGCQPGGCAGSHYAYAYIDAQCPVGGEIAVHHGTGCNATTATLTAPAWYGHYSWAGPGVVTDSTQAGITINHTGLYTLTLTAIDSGISPVIIDTFIAALGGNATANFKYTGACFGDTTAFTDLSLPHDSITTWAWDFDNNGTVDDTVQNPTHVFLYAGTYPIKLTVTSNACPAGDTIMNVVVTAPPTSTFTATSPVCPGQVSTLVYTGTADSSATYSFSPDGGSILGRIGVGQCTATWDTSGVKNIILRVTENGCVSAPTTVQLTVTTAATAAFTGDTMLCVSQNDTLVFTGISSNSASFSWNADNGNIVSTGFYQAPVVNWTSAGTQHVSLQVTENGCTSTDSLTIHVSSQPVANISGLQSGCTGINNTFAFSGTAGNYIYNWSFGDAIVTTGAGAGPYVVYWDSAGSKSITLQVSQAGCSSPPVSFPVTVNPTPTSTFALPMYMCVGKPDTITYTGSAGPSAVYSWNWQDGTPTSGAGSGPYNVIWYTAGNKVISLTVSEAGCSSTTTQTFNLDVCEGVNETAANTITIYPNPATDNFTVQFNGSITKAELALYDVVGQKVYTQQIANAASGYTTQINAPFARGVYILKLDAGNQQHTYKMVLQ